MKHLYLDQNKLESSLTSCIYNLLGTEELPEHRKHTREEEHVKLPRQRGRKIRGGDISIYQYTHTPAQIRLLYHIGFTGMGEGSHGIDGLVCLHKLEHDLNLRLDSRGKVLEHGTHMFLGLGGEVLDG